MLEVDVTIVGGGVAGSATAVALRRAGARVLVVERGRYATRAVGEHLPPIARPVLAELGLLERFLAQGHLACPGIRSSWGGPGLVERSYLFDAFGEGWNLDRLSLERGFADATLDAGGRVLLGARPDAIGRRGDRWRLAVSASGERIEVASRFLVDASGRAAAVARRLGARRVAVDDLLAVVGLCRAEGGVFADPSLIVEAGPDGWWYETPIPGGLAVAVWLTDRSSLASGAVDASGLWRQLARTSHLRVREAASLLELRTSSARTAWTVPAAGEAWLAVGDAALAPDPLSSTGLLSALETARAASRTICAAAGGSGSALESYGEWLEARRQRFAEARAATYAGEQRWADRPFWRRRHTEAVAPPDRGLPTSELGRPIASSTAC